MKLINIIKPVKPDEVKSALQTNNGCEKDGELPDKSNCRVKKVTDTLYECLSGTDPCRFLINFGFGKYCTWKLKNSASRLGSHVHAHWEDASERFVI